MNRNVKRTERPWTTCPKCNKPMPLYTETLRVWNFKCEKCGEMITIAKIHN